MQPVSKSKKGVGGGAVVMAAQRVQGAGFDLLKYPNQLGTTC